MWRNLIIQVFETRLLRKFQHPLYYYCFQISSIHESNLAKHLRTHILGLIQEALNKVAKG
ncbi:hypothetical protein OROMI_002620 [Orobanche minor]